MTGLMEPAWWLGSPGVNSRFAPKGQPIRDQKIKTFEKIF